MSEPVIDIGSNLEEHLERWSRALKGGGDKLRVFGVIYSSKRQRWTAKEISRKLRGKVSPKRVTEVGKKLVGDELLKQVPDTFPVVYEKRSAVHHYKLKILSLAGNKARRDALPTKRNVRVEVRLRPPVGGRAKEITIDGIDQFAKARLLRRVPQLLRPLPEGKFKAALGKLFGETAKFNDWGGEKHDFFTSKLRIGGKRHSAAFALKGPGVGTKTMTPGRWGKQGDQIQRLIEAPASVFLLQFEGTINDRSIEQLKKLTEHKAQQERRTLYYGYIDRDDSARLRRAYPNVF